LIVIPTADIREPGTYEIELQHDGQSGFPINTKGIFLNTQFGIAHQLEAGVDFQFSGEPDTAALYNFKYALPLKGLPIAHGMYNIGNHSKPIGYAVSGSRLGHFHIHVGAQQADDDIQMLLGAHREIKKLMLLADYTSGDDNFASAGLEYALSGSFVLQWGALFPNTNGKTEYTFHLIYNSRFR
jgi:hypothetical protein